MADPVFPDIVRDRASRKMDRDLADWLLASEEAELNIPLHPYTGRQAAMDIPGARAFNSAWTGDPHVQWESRAWHAAGLGNQEVPARFLARGAVDIARVAGREEEWREKQRKFGLLCNGASADVRATGARLWKRWVTLDDAELSRVRHLVSWFLDNPTSALLPRAVAVEGIHGKWLENNAPLVVALLSAARGFPDGTAGDLGLSSIEATIRLRRLDPALRGSESLEDISLPLSEAAALFSSGPRPRTVLMVENLATYLSFPPAPVGSGAVVIFTVGYSATLVTRLPWCLAAHMLYWGDLDSDGFAILHSLRSRLPREVSVQSVLMDPETVQRHLALGVPDPSDVSRILPTLTPDEESSRRLLVINGPLRIEQERIQWDYALDHLRHVGFPEG